MKIKELAAQIAAWAVFVGGFLLVLALVIGCFILGRWRWTCGG